jgi:hypothetical protein
MRSGGGADDGVPPSVVGHGAEARTRHRDLNARQRPAVDRIDGGAGDAARAGLPEGGRRERRCSEEQHERSGKTQRIGNAREQAGDRAPVRVTERTMGHRASCLLKTGSNRSSQIEASTGGR